ncbi:MAG: tRNA glutamyl-Q(34) synthetase GluQRS [Gammaproteobacteria bacterium]|nr:tRNA glutamyl-Q(34) synthetase GluQRS [Gammaproteobacteria bacterium]
MPLDIQNYRGRFAPSPTGPLHFGSLIAAVASYCQARSQKGTWLVRMEDVDELRNVAGAADTILRTLEAFGFEWDESVIYQTQRKDTYEYYLQQLFENNLIYRCTCSRRDLREHATSGNLGLIYPGTCDNKHYSAKIEAALRIRTQDRTIQFNDQIMGDYGHNLKQDLGDFIVKRRDGLFAYQLAVVIDDEFQQITDIVRGVDLLDSTPRQIYLQQSLNFHTPGYAHLPIAVNTLGDKLSKQTGAHGINKRHAVSELVKAMNFLGQTTEPGLENASLNTFWQWSMENWQLARIPDTEKITYIE